MFRIRMLVAVCFAVLTLSAIASSSAQAGWLVLGSLLVGSAAVAPTTVLDKRITAKYSNNVELECAALAIDGGTISEPDKFLIASLEFSSCAVLKPTSCKLQGTTVSTFPVEGLATLDGALATKAKVKPVNGTFFATFGFEGTECSLNGKQAIAGTSTVLVPTGQDERSKQAFDSIQEVAGELKEGSSSVTVEGSSLPHLESDETWSFN